MSVVVGLIDGAEVWVGADSAAVADDELTVRKDAKVFRRGGVVFGFTGNWRAGQLLRYGLEFPAFGSELTLGFMVREVVPAVSACIDEHLVDSDREAGFSILIGAAGRLFLVHGDYQVEEPADPYAAVGSGGPLALGALYATEGRLNARRRILAALEAAERFSTGVRGPFRILATGADKPGAESIYGAAVARTHELLDRDRATWCDDPARRP